MAAPFRVHTLTSTTSVQVDDVRCAAPTSPLGAEEAEGMPRLVLPRRGVFSWQAGAETHLARRGRPATSQALSSRV